MKKIFLLFSFVALIVVLGCSKEENTQTPTPTPTPTTGSISGFITLPPGAGGDITNTRVATYQSFDDWLNDRVLTVATTASNGAYAFNNVTPASYYLDGWKDNNNNQQIDTGDFFGVYGSGTYPTYQPSPFSVAAGQTTTISANIFPVP